MRDLDLDALIPKLVQALFETLTMVTVSFVIASIAGLLLALVLYATRPGNILQNKAVFTALNTFINLVRPIPFIILLVAISPLTRIVVGTSIGTKAAIVPLTIVCAVAIARVAETNLVAVDRGVIEAGTAMGARPVTVLLRIVIPESLGPLVLGFTYILVALVDATAVAGMVGGGGLGDLALTYGWQRFDLLVMIAVIVLLVALVMLFQLAGNAISRKVLHTR